MRVKFLRIVCVALLYGLPHLLTPGCASTQQEDEDLEASEQGGEQEEGGDENAEGNAGEGNEEASENGGNAEAQGEQVAEEGANGEEVAEGEEGGDEQLLEGEQTTNDLQEIIASQNSNQGEGNAAAQPETAEEVPVEEAATQTAATDAAAAPAPEGEALPEGAAPPANAAPATAGKGAGPALPEMNSKMPYIVRAGDTLAKIAQQIYGDTEKWREMAELTSLKNPNHVRPGDVVYYTLSEKTLAFATAYEGTPRMEVKVQTGDTLSAIAQRVYGSPMDWKSIWRQNAELINPDKLEVGQTLVYLAPASLSAAIDYAKSIKVADLIKMNFDQAAPEAQASQTDNSVSGFEIAAGMFSVMSTGLGISG